MRIGIIAALAAALLPADIALGQEPARTQPLTQLFSFADLAEKLTPAVVNIATTQIVEQRDGDDREIDPDDSFEEWFREFQPDDGAPSNQPRRRQASALGSGFIVDKSGYVVTNNHVIDGADQISVTLADDTVLEAKLIGRDERTDVALLKVESKTDLPTVPWGDSDKVRVGDWVIAIGNPFGLGGTVTTGIISARARDINEGNYDDFFQTDAAINRGNSGGPLFNLDGEVIGINTAIYSSTGGNVGVGFASAANLVSPILNDIRAYGRTRRGWLGVQIQSVNEDAAVSLGLPTASGALISTVADGGPAAKAGLRGGDVILTFDGKQVERMRGLPRIVAETEIDKTVDVVIWRRGKQMTVRVTVGELDDGEPQVLASTVVPNLRRELARAELKPLGVTVVEIDRRVRERFDLAPGAKGLLVVDVEDLSDAAEKGIGRGTVIDEIQQMPVETVEDAEAALKKAASNDNNRKVVLLRILNGENIRFVGVKLAQATADQDQPRKQNRTNR